MFDIDAEIEFDDLDETRFLSELDVIFVLSSEQVACDIMVPALQETLNIQGPPRSSPGEAPHRDFGTLQASIGYLTLEDDEHPGNNAVYVGVVDLTTLSPGGVSPNDYGFYLEFGTSTMAARPWFQNTLDYQNDLILSSLAHFMNHHAGQEGFVRFI